MRFLGKRVVIIGGSSGIGLETARLAISHGAKVTIAGRSQERLDQAASSLDSGNVNDRLRCVTADVTDESSINELFKAESTVDHVFVPAGELRPESVDVLTADEKDLRSILEIRLLAIAHVVRHAKAHMEGGSITLMSGLYASRPGLKSAMGAAAVAGVEGLVRALALDLAPLRVNAVAPGLIDTPLWDSFGPHKAAVLAGASRVPAGRIGRPEEVADAVIFLMSNEFVTGIVLPVDGGGRLV